MTERGEYDEIGEDQILTADQGIEILRRIAAQRGLKQWRWMGNYTNVYDPAYVANARGLGAGEVIININFNNGLIATWMFC